MKEDLLEANRVKGQLEDNCTLSNLFDINFTVGQRFLSSFEESIMITFCFPDMPRKSMSFTHVVNGEQSTTTELRIHGLGKRELSFHASVPYFDKALGKQLTDAFIEHFPAYLDRKTIVLFVCDLIENCFLCYTIRLFTSEDMKHIADVTKQALQGTCFAGVIRQREESDEPDRGCISTQAYPRGSSPDFRTPARR